MANNWQTWSALGIVAATVVIMLYRVLTRRKAGCGSDCGCHDEVKSQIRK